MLKGSLSWVDDWGCTHTILSAEIVKVIKELYNEWPCGLEEVESALASNKRVIQRLEQALLDSGYSREFIDLIKYLVWERVSLGT